MDTHALQHHHPETAHLTRWLVVGFICGTVSVLLFHQGAVALLHALGVTPRTAFPMQATQPFGIPQVWSLAFWGGVWGILLAAAFVRLDGARLLAASLVFGAVLPTLVAWFVVAPLKDQPIAAGWAATGMAVGLIANGAWGLGTGLGLMLFGRRTGNAP